MSSVDITPFTVVSFNDRFDHELAMTFHELDMSLSRVIVLFQRQNYRLVYHLNIVCFLVAWGRGQKTNLKTINQNEHTGFIHCGLTFAEEI